MYILYSIHIYRERLAQDAPARPTTQAVLRKLLQMVKSLSRDALVAHIQEACHCPAWCAVWWPTVRMSRWCWFVRDS